MPGSGVGVGVICLTGPATAVLAAPAALPTATAAVSGCAPGLGDLAARLREAGLTAQAANVAAQLAQRDCRRARIAAGSAGDVRGRGEDAAGARRRLRPSTGWRPGPRVAHGRVYREAGNYSAGAALLSELAHPRFTA